MEFRSFIQAVLSKLQEKSPLKKFEVYIWPETVLTEP